MTVELVDQVTLTDEQCDGFLEIFETNPGVNHVQTLRALGVPGTAGQIREAVDLQLRPLIAALRQDVVRRELYRRAIDGDEENIYWQDRVIGIKTVRSDACLIFLGKCTLPEARDQVELVGAGGGPVRVEVDDGRVSTVSGVLALAARLGAAGAQGGLLSAASRGALPAAEAVLPEAPIDQ